MSEATDLAKAEMEANQRQLKLAKIRKAVARSGHGISFGRRLAAECKRQGIEPPEKGSTSYFPPKLGED